LHRLPSRYKPLINNKPPNTKHFSKELINEITAYFSQRYGINLTEETAEEYLKALAEFCLAFLGKKIDRH
jgi:hypothetical protein